MKKIFNMLILSALALSMFTACEEDNDSNPTLKEPTSFVLNVPPYAANNVYDLKNATSLELTCSQPDYGFPAATTYAVQVTLDEEFTEAEGDNVANYKVLETTYTTAKMEVDALELNSAIIDLWNAKSNGADFPVTPMPVTVRLKANITGSDRGVCLSNVIELPNVLATTAAALKIPNNIYMGGTMLGSDVWKTMPTINGMKGEYFLPMYFKKDDSFKLGVKEKEPIKLSSGNCTIADKSPASVADGEVKVTEAGWYVVYVKTTIEDNEYMFNLELLPSVEVYILGTVAGQTGDWAFSSENKFTIPANGEGDFVSPALVAGGEIRMSVKVKDGIDWWKTEFTLYKGEIYYRENANIASNWNTDKGADYSAQASAGNMIYLNFITGKGEVK